MGTHGTSNGCRDARLVRPLSNIDTSPCRDARSERPLYHSKMASVVSQRNDSYSNVRPERPSLVPQRIQIPMRQHAELARCVPRRKNFFKHLVDWKSCSTFALATQKNGVSEVSEPYEW